MEAALRLARTGAVRDEVPVGAVIVRNDEGDTLAEAHNETITERPDRARRTPRSPGAGHAEDRPARRRHALRDAGTVCPVCGRHHPSQGGARGVRRVGPARRHGGIGHGSPPRSETQSPSRGGRRCPERGVRGDAAAVLPGPPGRGVGRPIERVDGESSHRVTSVTNEGSLHSINYGLTEQPLVACRRLAPPQPTVVCATPPHYRSSLS